jgi:hypothetical protein
MAKSFARAGFALGLLGLATAENMFDVMSAASPGRAVNKDLQNKILEVYPGASNCFTTGQVAEAPRSLSFCHKFNDGACCVPQLDDENNEFFGMLTNLGLSCRIRGDIRVDPLATFYCLNCDPEQPDYIRIGMSSMAAEEQPYSVAASGAVGGGDYYGDTTKITGDSKGEDDKGTLLVDVEWAAREFKTDPLLSGPDSRLSKCGLLVSVPCMGTENDDHVLAGRDRYTCGDDLIIPSNPDHGVLVWNTSAPCGEQCEALHNASLEAFLNFPSIGTPLIDESYYYKLVRNVECTADEATAFLNPHCLRSADQMTSLTNDELSRVHNVTMTYQDWVCAGQAAGGGEAWIPTSTSDNYCASVACPLDQDSAQLKAQKKLDNPCCCVDWKAEKAFSGASTFQPLFAISLAILAAVLSL